jgi:general secretion pathway protein F
MVRYYARILTASNAIDRIELDAEDEAAVHAALKQQGARALSVVRVRAPLGATGARRRAVWARRSIPFDVTLFAQELLALLRAGLSLTESIDVLAQKQAGARPGASSPGAPGVLLQLSQALREGERLSVALARQPEVFSPLFISLMQAAEGTSDLPLALARYIDYRQRIDQLRQALVSAAIYPAILLTVGLGVIVFLLGYVVPRFALVYRGSGRDLPWISQVMLDLGRAVAEHPVAVALATALLIAGAAVGLWRLVRTGAWLDALARLPRVGEEIRTFALARHYLTLGVLLQGGIALVPALQTVIASSVGSLRPALERVKQRIQRGEALSGALRSEGLSTAVADRLLRVGERSGDLGGMLRQVAEFYDGATTRFVARATRTIEPLLMVGIGLIVGLIVVVLYMPIFDLAGNLG